MGTPDGQDFDLHKALEAGTQRMTLRDLEQKGYQRVKVLDEKAVENLIAKAVARVVTTQAGEERARILADSRKELDRLMREHKAVRSHADLLKADRDELIQQVESLQRELELQSDLEEENLHKKFLEGTASMQAQVEELRRQLQAAKQEAEAARDLAPKLEEARQAAVRLKARAAEAEGALEALRRDLAGEQARARAAEQARGDVVAQVLRLQNEADAARAELKTLRAETSRLERDAAAALDRAGKEASSEQQRLARELESARVAAESALRAESRALAAARADVERLGAELERMRRQSSDEQVKAEASRQAEAALRSDAKALSAERDRLAAALEEAKNELGFAKARIAEQERMTESRRETAIVVAEDLKQIEQRRQEEERELERLRAEAAVLRDSDGRFAAELSATREDLRKMFELLAREQDLARTAQGESVALHAKSLELQGRAGELERYVGELRQARARVEALLEAERLKPVVAPKIEIPKPELPREIRDRLERLQVLVEKARRSSDAAAGASTATRERLGTLAAKQAKAPAPRKAPAAPKEAVGLDGPGLLGDFLRRIKLKELFQKHVSVKDRPGRRHPSETLVELVGASAAGATRPPLDPAARRLEVFGAPAGSTLDELRRFQAGLSSRAVRQIERVHDGLRHHLVPAPEKLVLDVDRPEIRLGRKGRAEALVCFDADRGEFWKARLGAGRGELAFLKDALAKLPGGFARGRLLLRLGSDVANEPVVRALDRSGAGYLAPAADDKALRADVRKATLREVSGGWEVGEIERRLHPIRATKGRYVILRRRASKKAEGPAPTFVDGRYAYHVFLADRRTTPTRAWAAWSGRAEAVAAARALLKGFGESPLLGRDRRTRAAGFAVHVLASDVLQWFKRAGLPESRRDAGHAALRSEVLMLAPPPERRRETTVLVLPRKDKRRRLYRTIADRLSRLRPAGAFKLGR